MSKIWIIIQREYLTRIRRPAFWIATLLAPAGFLALMLSSAFISTYNSGKTHVLIIDKSGLFKDVPFPDADDNSVYFHKETADYDSVALQLEQAPKEEAKYQAILLIPENYDLKNPGKAVIAFRYTERPGMLKKQFISQRVSEVVNKVRMQANNISEEMQEQLDKKVVVDYSSLLDEKEKSGYGEAASIAGIFMGFAIYISLFFYGTMIMKGVQEEKTSRIVEVLTSSVKPFQLLLGKIMGVGAVGLTQFVLWILLTMVVSVVVLPVLGITMASNPAALNNMNTQDIDPDSLNMMLSQLPNLPVTQIFILFPLFYLGGFLLYGSLFAAVGAAMGEDGDQQSSLMIPVTVPIVISVFIAINVVNNPDSPLGFWGSVIPFTSPVVMSTMLPFNPGWKQIALSIALLIGGFILTTYIAAKIYRVGILMYGKKITLKEMARWVFSKS